MVNPVVPAANAFLAIWDALPVSIKNLFYVVLTLLALYALYRLLTR